MDTSDRNKKAAARIDAPALAQAAALAVERAQAVRRTFVELSAVQTREVSGGLTVQSTTVAKPSVAAIKPPIIYGGIFVPVALAQ